MISDQGVTEDRILEAAHAVFLRRGTAGARMQEIADEAGVNKALIHYYFRSKEKLAEAVFRRAATELLPAVFRILTAPELSLEEKVERVVVAELDVLSRTPTLPGYVLSELHHHPERALQMMQGLTGIAVDETAREAVRILQTQLDREARAGRIRSIEASQFMVNLLALCIFPFAARPLLAAALGIRGSAFEAFIEERRRDLTRFFLAGLRP